MHPGDPSHIHTDTNTVLWPEPITMTVTSTSHKTLYHYDTIAEPRSTVTNYIPVYQFVTVTETKSLKQDPVYQPATVTEPLLQVSVDMHIACFAVHFFNY